MQNHKLLEENNIGDNLSDLGLGNEYLVITPTTQSLKEKLVSWTSLRTTTTTTKNKFLLKTLLKACKDKSQTGLKYL